MCTVTYVPQENGNFILTSNRDEQPGRSPRNLTSASMHHQALLFPRDKGAGGTWIAVSNQNRVVCLLNGAFQQHLRQPHYRISRGLMVLDFFSYSDARAFFGGYNFQGIEPFTFIVVETGSLYEFRWDGQRAYLKELPALGMHIWSSATLYPLQIQNKRQQWFAEWQRQVPVYKAEQILKFHQQAGEGDPWNDVIMNRMGLVQTVSITQIVKTTDAISLHYHDLVNTGFKKAEISLKGEVVESH